MALNHFGVCLEAEKSQKTVKNHLIFMIFPNFEKFSDFFFKTKTKKIIEIYCSELILMVNRFETVVFMQKTALQILKLMENRWLCWLKKKTDCKKKRSALRFFSLGYTIGFFILDRYWNCFFEAFGTAKVTTNRYFRSIFLIFLEFRIKKIRFF